MSTITKERVAEFIKKPLDNGLTRGEQMELARIALASLEAEAVAYMQIDGDDVEYNGHNEFSGGGKGVPLYTAPPAPVSVPDGYRLQPISEYDAMCGAMLQGANGTLTNEGTITATQFKPVADLYGLTSPTGGETSFTFDAVEARDFIDGGWSCQEYVELGRFQEAMLQNGNSPAQSDCCPEQNYIAPAQDGDSPVIPDGWVLVPEEPTHEMLEAGDEQFGTYDVYRRMIAASPQQK